MPKQRFPSWNPQVGELALVPGNPANAHYVDKLTAKDVEAIKAGHRGYKPLRIHIKYGVSVGLIIAGETFDLIWWDDRRKAWCSSKGGSVKDLRSVMRIANAYCTKSVKLYMDAAP